MMEIIPAIDIIDGKCVRLTQGNYSSCKIYASDPLEIAKIYEDAGFTRLHMVDLDGAKAAGVVHADVLEKVCSRTHLKVDFGGGIKSDQDIRKVFEAGASFACIGSIAVTDREKTLEWMTSYGKNRMIIGADVWKEKVCIQGWKKVTDISIFQLIEQYEGCIQHLMCTDITRDGMLEGTAVDLYRQLKARFPAVHLIASGGVGTCKDLECLRKADISSVIVGKAIYEKKIALQELKDYFN